MSDSILLINPPRYFSVGNIWNKIHGCLPPLGLALLAAILEEKNIRCDLLDCEAEGLTIEEIKTHVAKGKYTLMGITTMTITINNVLLIAKEIKKEFPKMKIILGGVHASVFYKELILANEIDYIIRNEGEISLLRLMQGHKEDSINNLSYKKDNEIFHTPDNPQAYDISKQPFLAYCKLPMNKYYSALGSYKRTPSMGMITTRGCPGICSFCFSGINRKKVQYLPAKRIVDEIQYLQKNYNIKEISFYDDTFTFFYNNVVELCTLLLENKINITWSCFSRIDCIDLPLLVLMKKAGCHQIMYGIETANNKLLKDMNKNIDKEKIEQVLRITKRSGISIRGAFIIGYPDESEQSVNETIAFAKKMDIDIALFNIITPFPGTKLYFWAKENHLLLSEDWNRYDLATPLLLPSELSIKRLKELYFYAYKAFYFRITYIIKRLFLLRSFAQVISNAQALFSLLFMRK